MFGWLTKSIFGDKDLVEFPPAGSGRRGEWDERDHNVKLVRVMGRKRSKMIRAADEQSKATYDTLDRHLKMLRDLRDRLRRRRRQEEIRA
jgi:hypothetical protein